MTKDFVQWQLLVLALLLNFSACDGKLSSRRTPVQTSEDIRNQPLESITLPFVANFKLREVADGKPGEKWLVCTLSVSVDGLGKTNVVWEHVVVNTLGKRLILVPELFAEEWGRDIHGFEIKGSSASLVLNVASDRPMQIMLSKHRPANGGAMEYEVRGTALWWSDILKRQTRVEWEPIFGPLALPYREVE